MINTCQRSADGRPKPFCIYIDRYEWVFFCIEARHRGPLFKSIEWGMDSSAEYLIWLAVMRTTKTQSPSHPNCYLLSPPSRRYSPHNKMEIELCRLGFSPQQSGMFAFRWVFDTRQPSPYIFQHSAGGIHVLRPNEIHNKYAVCTGYSPYT